MYNLIVSVAHFGPVYKHRINVYYRNELTENTWRYAYSTNASKTCREAKNKSSKYFPNSELKANFNV